VSRPWLRRFPRLRLLHAALIALLLFVQHGALNHALLHAIGNGAAEVQSGHAAHADGHAHEGGLPEGEGSASCGFDLLYSEVLGGVSGNSCSPAAGKAGAVLIAAGGGIATEVSAVPYDSRAPPAFS